MAHVNQRVRKARKARVLDSKRAVFTRRELSLEWHQVSDEIRKLENAFEDKQDDPNFGNGFAQFCEIKHLEELSSALYRVACRA